MQVGDEARGVQCLEEMIEVAAAAGPGEAAEGAQAEAYENLGVLAARRGDTAQATAHLEKAFALREAIVRRGGGGCTRADLQRSRLFVGLSRAQGMSAAFIRVCLDKDLRRLFPFKDGREAKPMMGGGT